MRFVIQVCSSASVEVNGSVTGSIGRGYMVLIGINDSDTEEIADKMIDKMLRLRINPDSNGKTNLSLSDVGGDLLLVSQFTLYADCHHGNRPSFVKAGNPEHAKALYDYIVRRCAEIGPGTETGIFGADMKVSLVNEGPFTIILDSDEIVRSKK